MQTVIDIATLTGAAGVALGQDTAALFANNDSLAAAIDTAGKAAGTLLTLFRLLVGVLRTEQADSNIDEESQLHVALSPAIRFCCIMHRP